MVNPFPESKILIIDDDLNLQSSLKRLLIKENFIVAVASEGMEALSLMEKFKPNCILLDLGMPYLNGKETLRMTKWLHPTSKIIIISGFAELYSITTKTWTDMGAFCFVPKPIKFEELLVLIIQALESKTIEHESRQQF